jgi:hypothetical protein
MEDNINLINKFWEEDIWNIDYKKIYHERIREILNDNHKLNKKLLNNNTIINIDQNYDIEVVDHTYILDKIEKFKRDNLNYIKKHAECIPEYHFLLIKLINKKLEINKESLLLNNEYNIGRSNIYEVYEEFIKKINIEENELYKKVINKLKENIDLNIDNIEKLCEIKEKILVLDTENLLKSIKVQYLLKKHIINYDEIFRIWNYGNLYEFIEIDSNITLSEYSNNTKYIEPYMSLSLSFNEKYELIKIFIENYLKNYYVVYTITSKNYIEHEFIDNSNNYLCIPIFYNKHDIREQDDHLITYITYYINTKSKNNDIYLISNDKFRWFNNQDNILIKNFNFMYDYDNKKIELIIMNQNMYDVIKIENKLFSVGYHNFPIIDNIITDEIFYNDNIENIENIKNALFLINYNLLKYNNIDTEKFINIINEIIQFSIKIYNNIKIIFSFLKNNTRNNIFNYNINIDQLVFKEDNEININLLQIDIKNYKILCEAYIILKTINIRFQDKDSIIRICKLYSIIIFIYDNIHDYLSKIRKLSNNKSVINKLFLDLHCTYLYIKKIGISKREL